MCKINFSHRVDKNRIIARFVSILPYLEVQSIRRLRVPSFSLLYSTTYGKILIEGNSRLNLRTSHSEVRVMGKFLFKYNFKPNIFYDCLLLTNNIPCWYCMNIMKEKSLSYIVIKSKYTELAFVLFFKKLRFLIKIRQSD